MELREILQNIGLTEKEARVYLTLLEYKEALPSSIAKHANIKRPTTYIILEQLEKRGLASHVKRGNSLHYRALDPNTLLEEEEARYSTLKKAIPELLSLNQRYSTTPQMSVFEGEEGIIRIMEDTLTTKTELLCWADVEMAVGGLLKNYYPKYIAKKIKNNVYLRGILGDDELARRFKKEGKAELRDVRLIPKDKFPFKNEINIYDEKVAIISHQDKVGVIIQNKNIADTQRAIFEMGWEYAKILEGEV